MSAPLLDPSRFSELRDQVTYDERFQAACQRYAHGNGSSAAIAAAAINALFPEEASA